MLPPARPLPLVLALVACATTVPDETTVRVRVTVQDTPPLGLVVAGPPQSPPPRRALVARPPAPPPPPPPPACGTTAENVAPDLAEFSVGHGHSCARMGDGTVRCWGANLDGQMGNGESGSDRGPAAPAVVPDVAGVAQVCAGFSYSCARFADGRAACWGNNTHNQLNFSLAASCASHPVRSPLAGIRSLTCGAWHVCAIRRDGSAWCWGEDAPRYSPWRVRLPARVEQLAAGRRRTCALLATGAVYCWTVTTRAPAAVTGFPARVVQLAAAEQFGCARLEDGRVACWGAGYHGELGNGAALESREPVVVPGVTGAVQVAVTEERACAVTGDGAVWCWGSPERARRGRAREEAAEIVGPTRVEALGAVRALALGERHACARTEVGALCCWGRNGVGQLGDNRTTSPDAHTAPVAVVW